MSRIPPAFFCLAALFFLSFGRAQDTEIQYLSGQGKDDAIPWKFFCSSGRQSGYWTNLPVPSEWDAEGFGAPPGATVTNGIERGRYDRQFLIPGTWAGRRIWLVFEGVMTDTEVRFNGRLVGPRHQGGWSRFHYELTPFVSYGYANQLDLTVDRHLGSDGDDTLGGGIYRPLYLEALPPQFIERVAIQAGADGAFLAQVYLNGATNVDTIEAQIQTVDGANVGLPFQSGSVNVDLGTHAAFATLQGRIEAPRLWTAETPNLYRAEFRIKHNGQVIHRVQQRFGFRTVEQRDGDLYVNGRKVILRGVSRPSFWPDSGRCLSAAVHRLDLATLRDANVNFVRVCPGPPDALFLDLCDELGFYVIDDLPAESAPASGVSDMVNRDVNHPCVVAWEGASSSAITNTDLRQRPLFRSGDLEAHFPMLFPDGAAPSAGGIVGPRRERGEQWAALREAACPIQVCRASNDVFLVANHLVFTDTHGLKFTWQLRKFASPLATNDDFTVLREGQLDVPTIPPGQSNTVKISAALSKTAEALAVRVEDATGRELWTWVWPVRRGEYSRLNQEPAEYRAEPVETNGLVTITAGDLSVGFSRDTGWLHSIRRGGQKWSLAGGPRLAGDTPVLRQLHFDDDGPDAYVSAKYTGNLKSVFWRVNGNGWINCDYTYVAAGANGSAGVQFDCPADWVRHMRWLGNGPYVAAQLPAPGLTLGVWEKDPLAGNPAAFLTGTRWLQLSTPEGPVTIINNDGAPVVKLPGPAEGGLTFLSKWHSAGGSSPESATNAIEYSGSLSFYFGKVPDPQ